MAPSAPAQFHEERTWLEQRYGWLLSRYVMDVDAYFVRYDDREARLFALNELEWQVRMRQTDHHRMKVRAIAIWRLRRQLTEQS